ncbi:MAG TPA: hypothetical protein VFS67_25820 [Polyangiaceae bacterium]|nr:hypothetical protein [Polyangiaceae bacterium]
MAHEHIIDPDGVERILWADGTETDLWGYRSGAFDSWCNIFARASAGEDFTRLLERVNTPGSDTLS